MKKSILFLFLSFALHIASAQNRKFDYKGRMECTFNVDKINDAHSLRDICPLLWLNIGLRKKIIHTLDSIKKAEFPLGYYATAPVNYDMLVDYYNVEIIGFKNKQWVSAISNSDILSPEQKKLINSIEIGSNLKLVITFKIKDRFNKQSNQDFITGHLDLCLVPSFEAKFPGGYSKFTDFINQNIFDQYTTSKDFAQLSRVKIKFTIDQVGAVTNIIIVDSSTNKAIDAQIMKALTKMPKWQAALNAQRVNVAQTFEFLFESNGC
jgi:TonB family protein